MNDNVFHIPHGWTTALFTKDECPLYGKITIISEDGTIYGTGKGVIFYGNEYIKFTLDADNVNQLTQTTDRANKKGVKRITVKSSDFPRHFTFNFEPYSHKIKKIMSDNAYIETTLSIDLSEESTGQFNGEIKPLPDKEDRIVSVSFDADSDKKR